MKNEIDTHKIKELLTISTTQLTHETLDKLRSARTHALNHQRVRHSVPVLAWLGHHGTHNNSFHFSKPLNWTIAAVFVACLISGASLWRQYSIEHEICDVDVAILTDDMPIHVYLD
jgi:hypothetical protein